MSVFASVVIVARTPRIASDESGRFATEMPGLFRSPPL